MKNRTKLIISCVIIIIIVIVAYLSMSGILIQNGKITSENPITTVPSISTNPNAILEKHPSPELLEQLRNFNFRCRDFAINKWEFGPDINEITLYAYDIRNESQIEALQGTHIGNYTVRIIHDTEFEKTRDEVSNNLTLLMKDSRYKINTIEMGTSAFWDPTGYTAEVWVYELTPENKKLDNTTMQEWKIEIIQPSFDPENYKPLTKIPTTNMSGGSE